MGSMESFVIWGTFGVGQATMRARSQDSLVYAKVELNESSWSFVLVRR